MPRAVGQIDEAKRAAILEAAGAEFSERGPAASLEAIARRAGVSKQTLYNQFGCREGLLRYMVERRSRELNALFEADDALDNLEDTLTAFAGALMRRYLEPRVVSLLSAAIGSAVEHPDLARAIHAAGPNASRARLAEYLRSETALGRLATDDPFEAAEVFSGMATGSVLISVLLRQSPSVTAEQVPSRARECAQRFIRAYAP